MVFSVPVVNRHGQSVPPSQRGNLGVYKTGYLDTIYGKTTDWDSSATAICVVHFGTGNH